MNVAFILHLDLPTDNPEELSAVEDEITHKLEGDFTVLSVAPWSRDATQLISQLGLQAQPTQPLL